MNRFLVLLALNAVLSATMTAARADDEEEGFNHPGNILITDQFNNRVIEINRAGKIVFQFGLGPNDISPNSIVGTNDAERVGDLTLMAGTGIPPNTTQGATQCLANGCFDNRVLLVDRDGHIVWQYGQFGVTGPAANIPDFNVLNVPVQNTFLPNGNVLITDQANERIIEVRRSDKAIVWQYGVTGTAGIDPGCPGCLNNPNAAELLANGHILISDENNNRAIEVTHTTPSTIVATFTVGGTASGVAFASRLPHGHTLITDSNNSRIVEVNRNDEVVWEYFTNTRAGSNPTPLPTRAVQLANGHILISDQFNNQVIEVKVRRSNGSFQFEVVASYGKINQFGFDPGDANVLNAPYSAYKIGDYTGLTPPF